MANITFEGKVYSRYNCRITCNGTEVDLFLDEVNHSPTGFAWGYLGSGPSQTAYAVLRFAMQFTIADVSERIFWAKRLYMRFKQDVIANFPQGRNWTLSLDEINAWIMENKGILNKEWEEEKKYG